MLKTVKQLKLQYNITNFQAHTLAVELWKNGEIQYLSADAAFDPKWLHQGIHFALNFKLLQTNRDVWNELLMPLQWTLTNVHKGRFVHLHKYKPLRKSFGLFAQISNCIMNLNIFKYCQNIISHI